MVSDKRYAYITLATRASYLAGVITLGHTLQKQGSQYPLIVYYVSLSSVEAIDVGLRCCACAPACFVQ